MSFLAELRRRNVIRVAGLYVVSAWLLLQVAETLLPIFDTPGWVLKTLVLMLGVGFVPTLVFSWAFELTPEGLKRERDVDRSQSIVDQTARKLDIAVIALLLLIGALIVWGPKAGSESTFASTPEASGISPRSKVDSDPNFAQPDTITADARPAIAVLPFADMSRDKDQEYFSDGLSEELLNLLAQLPQLRVIARTSSFSFKGKDVDIATIADALDVDTVLEGSVRKSGNRLRVTAQLIRASDASHLWSQTFDRELTDVFAVQDEIARAVVDALKLQLLPAQPVAHASRSDDPEAHRLYLLGRQHFRRSELKEAAAAFREAIARDANYAAAYASLSMVELFEADGIGDNAGKLRSLEQANRAITLAPESPEGYLARAVNRLSFERDWSGALSDYQHAMTLNAGSSQVQGNYGRALLAFGRIPEAVATLRRTAELDPLSAQAWAQLGRALSAAGDYAQAEQALQRSISLVPDADYALFHLGVSQLLQGRAQDALDTFSRASRTPDGSRCTAGTVMALYSLGDTGRADQILDAYIDQHAASGAYQIAEAYAWQGDRDQAFAWLQRAREHNDGGLAFLKSDPLMASLKSDPRFAAFQRELGLPE